MLLMLDVVITGRCRPGMSNSLGDFGARKNDSELQGIRW